MKQYLDMVKYVLNNGVKKENRTGVDTISTFAYSYKVDLSKGYPLLTTKKMYFNSMLHELFWYLSGKSILRTDEKRRKYGMLGQMRKEGSKRLMEDFGEGILYLKFH